MEMMASLSKALMLILVIVGSLTQDATAAVARASKVIRATKRPVVIIDAEGEMHDLSSEDQDGVVVDAAGGVHQVGREHAKQGVLNRVENRIMSPHPASHIGSRAAKSQTDRRTADDWQQFVVTFCLWLLASFFVIAAALLITRLVKWLWEKGEWMENTTQRCVKGEIEEAALHDQEDCPLLANHDHVDELQSTAPKDPDAPPSLPRDVMLDELQHALLHLDLGTDASSEHVDSLAVLCEADAQNVLGESVRVEFVIGERVRCRDSGKQWHVGVVTSVWPLRVKPDGWNEAEDLEGYEWSEVHKSEQDSLCIGDKVRMVETDEAADWTGCPGQRLRFMVGMLFTVADIHEGFFRTREWDTLWAPVDVARTVQERVVDEAVVQHSLEGEADVSELSNAVLLDKGLAAVKKFDEDQLAEDLSGNSGSESEPEAEFELMNDPDVETIVCQNACLSLQKSVASATLHHELGLPCAGDALPACSERQ